MNPEKVAATILVSLVVWVFWNQYLTTVDLLLRVAGRY